MKKDKLNTNKKLYLLLFIPLLFLSGCVYVFPFAVGGTTYLLPIIVVLLFLAFSNPKIMKFLIFGIIFLVLFTAGIFERSIFIVGILLFIFFLTRNK